MAHHFSKASACENKDGSMDQKAARAEAPGRALVAPPSRPLTGKQVMLKECLKEHKLRLLQRTRPWVSSTHAFAHRAEALGRSMSRATSSADTACCLQGATGILRTLNETSQTGRTLLPPSPRYPPLQVPLWRKISPELVLLPRP